MSTSEFVSKSLHELRIRAGLTQLELARMAGVSNVTIGYIEQGRVKPRESTWRKCLKALSQTSKYREQPNAGDGHQPSGIFSGEVLSRDEFFIRLKPKMNQALNIFFDEPLVSTLIDNAEFFSRQRFYPGDFSTAVEILGKLLRAQKRLFCPDFSDDDERIEQGRRQRILPGGYKKKCPKKQ